MRKDQANKIIDELFGGTFAMAEICEVKPPSVSAWRKSGIPHARLMFLKAAFPEKFLQIDAITKSAADGADVHTSQPALGATS